MVTAVASVFPYSTILFNGYVNFVWLVLTSKFIGNQLPNQC